MRRAFVLLAGLVVTVAGCNTSHSEREENDSSADRSTEEVIIPK